MLVTTVSMIQTNPKKMLIMMELEMFAMMTLMMTGLLTAQITVPESSTLINQTLTMMVLETSVTTAKKTTIQDRKMPTATS